MSLQEAIALQPQWVQIWLNWLLFGAFILPASLLIWRRSRVAGLVTLICSGLGAAGVMWLYGQMGYVKLLGVAHVVVWTPLIFFLLSQTQRAGMPGIARGILYVVIATITVSLLFDYADLLRYALGDRTPLPGTLIAQQ